MFDSWAGELSPASFKEFSQPYLAYIAKRLPQRLQELELDAVPTIVFPKGAWYALDSVADLGYNVVGLDWLHDPAEVVKTIGDRSVVIQGNADPGVLYGSHASITEAVKNMVEGFRWAQRKSGWIVNLGHGKCLSTHKSYCFLYLTDTCRDNTIRQPRRSQVLLPRSPSPYCLSLAVTMVHIIAYKRHALDG